MSKSAATGDQNSGSRRHTVTIGMPVFNGARHLEQALRGLLGQTFTDFTLVVSDNASDDGTWEILEKWAATDERIVLHRQSENIGATANFRFLLDCADTEYFMWHAADDWLAPNYLEELKAIISADPGCALACPVTKVVEQDGTPSNKKAFPPPIAKSKSSRIKQQLLQPQGSRIYGLFRTETARWAAQSAWDFGGVWSWDLVMLLPMVLDDRIRGTDRTCFYFRRGSPTGIAYRPGSPLERLRFWGRYLSLHRRVWSTSRLSTSEKVSIWPWLLVHAARSQHTHPIKWFITRPLKRARKVVFRGPVKSISGSQ